MASDINVSTEVLVASLVTLFSLINILTLHRLILEGVVI